MLSALHPTLLHHSLVNIGRNTIKLSMTSLHSKIARREWISLTQLNASVHPFQRYIEHFFGSLSREETSFIQLCDAFSNLSIPWTILKDGNRKNMTRPRKESDTEARGNTSSEKGDIEPESNIDTIGSSFKRVKILKRQARRACSI